MRMQEVITQLRELAPAAAHNARQAYGGIVSLKSILEDASHAQSMESIVALLKLASDKLMDTWTLFGNCADITRRLQELNESYKEKIGPRAKKPKDAPGQMELPGISLGPETVGRDAQ